MAPCECVWTDERRYVCTNCPLICRDRHVAVGNNSIDSFSLHVNSTKSLQELTIKQNLSANKPFPLLIPTQTRQLPTNTRLDWTGVAFEDLITGHRRKPPLEPKKYLMTPSKSRGHLRANVNGNLIAVMNSNDKTLEHFWASDRMKIYEALKLNGFMAVTGPTFSVYRSDPDAHSVVMLRRQFQVLQELYERNLTPIPNIYWRNERDRDEWINWLSNNKTIDVVSRDFSSTTKGVEYSNGIEDLIDTLIKVGRSFHILLNGIGHSKVGKAAKAFINAGFTFSFITSDPVLQGRNGKALIATNNSGLISVKQPNSISFSDLALRNVNTMENYLTEVVLSYS